MGLEEGSLFDIRFIVNTYENIIKGINKMDIEMTTKILLVDDHPLFLKGLSLLINEEKDYLKETLELAFEVFGRGIKKD